MKRVYAVRRGLVNSSERLVLLVLAESTADELRSFAHGFDVLEHRTGMANRTLRRHLTVLDSAGFISKGKTVRQDDGTWLPVSIRLTIDAGSMGEGCRPLRRETTPADIARLNAKKLAT